MTRLVLVALVALGCAGHAPAPRPASEPPPLERYSVMAAIKNGYLNGTVDVGTVRARGNFGLGGFESFSGEMLLLDGVVYRIPVTGVPEVARDTDQLTYAELTRFQPTFEAAEASIGKKDLLAQLNAKLANPNEFYSIKITGTFTKLKYRTLIEQPPPYHKPICAKFIDKMFEKDVARGTIIGFLSPGFVKGGIDYPGSHLHFLSADHGFGGHVYDFEIASATVEIAGHPVFTVHLPAAPSFAALSLEDTLTCPEQN